MKNIYKISRDFIKRSLVFLCGVLLTFSVSAKLVFVTEENAINTNNFIINADDSSADFVDLEFGSALGVKMRYDIINDKFVLNRDLEVENDIKYLGTVRAGAPGEPGRWRYHDSTGYLMSFWNNSTDYDNWGLKWDTTPNELQWMGNGTEAASINLSTGDGYFRGKLGIGNDTPNAKLDVKGDAYIDKDLLVKDSEIIHTGHTYKDSFLEEELIWNLLQTQKTSDPNDKDFPTITSGNGWKDVLPITRWKVGDESNNGQHYGYVGYFPAKNEEFRINTGGNDKTNLVFGTMAKDVIYVTGDTFRVGINDDSPDADLDVAGSFRLDGTFADKDGDVGTVGQVLSSTATGTNWITNTSNPIPRISNSSGFSMNPSTTTTLIINGENFTPTTTVSIPGFDGTINTTTINSSTELEINITSGTTQTVYDIVISNNGVLNTEWAGNGVGLLTVAVSTWKDLRLGGDAFTDGNAAGNDIRYRSGMTMSRDANGMYFNGSNPWSSWVKFESLSWTRGTNKTISWIFDRPTSSMMIGIGSTTTDETSTAQYYQAEILAYFSSSTNFGNFYGRSTSQSVSSNISGGSGVFKLVMTNDGGAGSTYTLYELPSASPADWDDVSNVRMTGTITAGFAFSGTTIMPFIIPRDSTSAQRFIAVKVE